MSLWMHRDLEVSRLRGCLIPLAPKRKIARLNTYLLGHQTRHLIALGSPDVDYSAFHAIPESSSVCEKCI